VVVFPGMRTLKDDFFGKPRSERAQEFLSKILSH
jgi:hypothetical protein